MNERDIERAADVLARQRNLEAYARTVPRLFVAVKNQDHGATVSSDLTDYHDLAKFLHGQISVWIDRRRDEIAAELADLGVDR